LPDLRKMKNKFVEEIQNELVNLSEEKYREFTKKLIPNVNEDRILGIRTPVLRSYAKELNNSGVKNLFLDSLPHNYLEENSLHMYLLEDISDDPKEIIHQLNRFLPYVDNWATCDGYRPKKLNKYPKIVEDAVNDWLNAKTVYEVRFGIVMSLKVLLGENFSPGTFDKIIGIKSKEYYINIAIAWYICEALIKNYDYAFYAIEKGRLDKWVNNKAIQKCRESYRISDELKEYLKGFKK